MKHFLAAVAVAVVVWLTSSCVHAASVATTAYFPNIVVRTNAAVNGALAANNGVFTNGASVAINSLINLDLSGGSFLQSVTGGSTLFKSTASAGANGNIVIWPSGDLYSRANLYPNTASTYSLGSATLPWTTIFGQTLTLTNGTAGTSEITINGPASPTAAKIVFNSGGVLQGGLFVPAANTYELRNSTAAQTVLVGGTFTDTSNYRRGKITDSTAGVFDIGSEGLGTGATGNTLRLLTDGTARWTVNSSGHLLAGIDNTYDIGASGATRPRTIYTGTDVNSGNDVLCAAGGSFKFTSRSRLDSASDGVIQISNAAKNDFTRLQFGGTTASFPSIKRSSATLQARLADDSAYAVLTSGGVTDASAAAATTLGEVVSSNIAVGSAVSLTTATAANVTSISLTAGDWRVSGNVNFAATTATVTGTSGGITVTSATVPTDGTEVYSGVQVTLLSETDSVTIPGKQINVNATTTVYLVGKSTFSAGSVAAFGSISARRIR